MSSGPGRRVLALCCALLVVLGSWLAPRPAAAAETGKLVMVLDSSGSMKARVGGKSKISIAKAALASVVRGLPADAPVGLRVYGATVFDRSDKGACTDSQLVVPIGTGNRDALQDEIRQYEPYGETPISYSLQQAAGDLGKDGKRTILLVSDGEETCDADPCETAAAITEAGVDVKVDVVGLAVSGKVRDQLRCVADKGNGTYYDADSADDLEESLDKLATRAFRPFRLTGTPVEGAAKAAGAPVVGPGQHLDRFDRREKALYYRVPRSIPGSTLRVGFTTRPAGQVATAAVRLRTTDGRDCGNGIGQAIAIGGGTPLVTGEADSWVSDEESPCVTADTLVATVVSLAEELTGTRFELLVSEEPPVTTTRGLPGQEEELRWRSMKAAAKPAKPPVPGSSISDAGTLEPGTYRTSILTGETQVFAVPADWGQRVQVQVTIAPRTGALARALSVSDTLRLQLLGSGRGLYSNLPVTGEPERSYSLGDDDEPYRVAETTPVIRYLNRTSPGPASYGAVPGAQYVVLNMDTSRDDAFLVPYTLQVEVLGRAGAGAPTYAGASTPTPTPTPTPSPAASTPAAVPPPQEEDDDDGVPTPVVLGIALGTLVLGAGGVLAALALGRRRRRS